MGRVVKKKNISKKIVAVLLSIIMLATSIPFAIIGSAAGDYNPSPAFSEEAIKAGADAWLDEDGNVQVVYPAATPGQSYNGVDKTVDFYIVELVDTGLKDAVHTENIIATVKSTGTTATFDAADIGTIDLENHRYSVTITAVGTGNWFSQSIYVNVTTVPAVQLNADRFEAFSTSDTAVREIMTFDQDVSGTNMVSGNALLYMGVAAEAGTEDLSDNVGDTSALRFIMNDLPSGTQTFDTSLTRQTWDFSNATELWYWFDLTGVELQGVSFRLRANEKVWYDWGKDSSMTVTQKDYMGDIIYSTKGYTGTDGYVWVQRDDGGWDKVNLTNGTVTLSDFKGYVRVPISFICSENDSVAQLKNTGFNNGNTDFATGWNSATLTNGDNHANGIPITKVVVDPAGTNIKTARLMQHRIVATKTGIGGLGNANYWHFTNGSWVRNETEEITRGEDAMIAAGLSDAEVFNDADEGYKAIDDLYSAGFAFTGSTAESLQNSFFVDNIFFYDENGGPWDSNAVSGMTSSTGNSMATYYDEELEISRIIFDEIDKFIATPDWADYREITYILDLIEGYRQIFAAKGKDTEFLALDKTDVDGDGVCLAAAAEKLGRDSWAVAWAAYEACLAAGTYGNANASKFELVPLIIQTMEKLPAPENIASVSDALRAEIIKLWKAYGLLNLGQLEMLGKTEEEKILEYIALLNGMVDDNADEFIVGQALADFPYIVYNDFENQALGTTAYQIADNKNAFSTGYTSVDGRPAGTHNPGGGVYTMADGWRHTKGLTTYTTNGSVNITNEGDYGYSPTDSDYEQEVMDGRVNYSASSVEVTDKGYLNSHAATMNIDSSFTTDNQNGVFHTVTLARQGKDSANWTEFQANNTGLDNLGALSTENVSGTTSIGLSLIFYVDFTELSNFYFTTNIYTKNDSGTPIKARPNMGIALNDDTKINDWKYFILDPVTGEWVINHTTSQWCFTSTMTDASWGDTLSLDGYKGYIMIPLYHIKIKESAVSEPKLDGNATWLNNIYAIQFCIGGANGNSLDEKSFTIDNVGFTYDPAGYSNVSHTSYADKFKAKSIPAKQFEEKVASIDPYDDLETVTTLFNEAKAMYEALPGAQKELVGNAKMLLGKYELYVKGQEAIPEESISPADLSTYVSGLPAELTGSSVTGTSDIPYPGFVNGEVNYASMGIDKATAEQIITYYNTGYSRFSKTQKNSMTNKTEFLNAYNMAMRLTQTLEGIKTDAMAFLPKLTEVYIKKTDADGNTLGNFVSIADREAVQNFWDTEYESLQYYSKMSIDDGSIYPQLTNTSRGLTYFLKNTETYTIGEETIKGGVLGFQDNLQMVYDIASQHINDRVRFTQDELQYVKDILAEYNSLLPAYYNVEELYQLEQDILGLFSVSDIGVFDAETDGNSVSQVELTNDTEDTMKKTVYVDLTYIAALLDTTVTLQAVSDLKLTLTAGTGNPDLQSFTAGSLEADTPLTLGTYDNLYPDEVFSRIPIEVAIDPVIGAKVPTGSVYEGKITFNVYETADIDNGLTGEDLVPIATLEIPVIFTSTNGANPVHYKVEIPADQTIEWDYTGATDVSYKIIEANLESGILDVSVADANADGDGENYMTSTKADADGTYYKLQYDATGFEANSYTGSITTETTPDPKPSMTITQAYWDKVPVGEYKTTLTYTVVYKDGSTS